VVTLLGCAAKVQRRDSQLTEDCYFVAAYDGVTFEELAEIHLTNEELNKACNKRMAQIRSGW